MIELREELTTFAKVMEVQLQNNDHKDGWENCSVQYLLCKLLEEIGEMSLELNDEDLCLASKMILTYECADAANILMMIADNEGESPLGPEA